MTSWDPQLTAGGLTPAVPFLMDGQKCETTQTTHLHRIIRLRDLPDFVGLKRTQIDALIIRGEFPKPIKLNDLGRAKGWLEHELISWQQERIAARDAEDEAPIGGCCRSISQSSTATPMRAIGIIRRYAISPRLGSRPN